ncbi:MAG: DUF2851 family protein [Rhodothermales bacterium]
MQHTDPSKTRFPDLFFYSKDEEVFEVKVFEPDVLHASIPESLIHSIWRKQSFNTDDLKTVDHEPIYIKKPGTYNLDGGPDFLDAAIELNGMPWYGDIELHLTSSDWFYHKHHENTRYNSTILHVTLFEDKATGQLTRQDGSLIPELVLSPLLKSTLRSLLYIHRTAPQDNLPCADYLRRVKLAYIQTPACTQWLTDLGRKRLIRKAKQIEEAYLGHPNLEDLLHQMIFTGLGYAKNSDAMYNLSVRLPLEVVRTLKSHIDIEALHLGVAGLLPSGGNNVTSQDADAGYVQELTARFVKLNKKMRVPMMSANAWQFFRLRPANFPPLRVAQAAALYADGGILHADSMGVLDALLSKYKGRHAAAAISSLLQIPPAPFWSTHYQFNKTVKIKSSLIGHARINKLLLNAFLPALLVYAEQSHNPSIEQAVFNLFMLVKGENDTVTSLFSPLELEQKSAALSQGLHELHDAYCTQGKCLLCNIGISIVNNDLGHTT